MESVATPIKPHKALAAAQEAAMAAGKLMFQNVRKHKKRQEESQHDIKLELDQRCQRRIEKILRSAFPTLPVLGEEGFLGDVQEPTRWIVDPIDGTVNFTHGLPHACVSIALQERKKTGRGKVGYETVLGLVYDPFLDEMWTALKGKPGRLNGRLIRPSSHSQLKETMLAIGFSKTTEALDEMLPAFNQLVYKVPKSAHHGEPQPFPWSGLRMADWMLSWKKASYLGISLGVDSSFNRLEVISITKPSMMPIATP